MHAVYVVDVNIYKYLYMGENAQYYERTSECVREKSHLLKVEI